jgi:hypothetical protein
MVVSRCRRIEGICKTVDTSARKKSKDNDLSIEQERRYRGRVAEVLLHFAKGDLALERECSIEKWMYADRNKDEIRKKNWETEGKKNKICPRCNEYMEENGRIFCHEEGREDEIIIMYDCPHCSLREVEYQDGTIWKAPISKCPKCKAILEENVKETLSKVTIFKKCPQCDHEEKFEYDLRKKKKTKSQLRKEYEEKEQFEKDLARFTLTREEIDEYITEKASLESLGDFLKEIEQKENDKRYYDQLQNIKRLNAFTVQNLIAETLAEIDFQNTSYTEANRSSKDFILEFVTYESDESRNEGDGKRAIRKTLQEKLLDTNWRLIKTSIESRMGVYSGRVRALESDEAIVNELKKD